MNSSAVRSADSLILSAVLIIAAALLLSLMYMPSRASAAAVSVTSITATSSNVYVNTGFATTSRVTTGDAVKFQLNLGGTPLIAPQINIFNMGSTTMSGSAGSWFYSTTSVTAWTEGALTYYITIGSDDGGAGTTTRSQANVTTNVTYDKTAPTLSSVSWSDVDGSTNISGTDTLTFTFSETMATTTLTGANLDTVLALANSHTFSTTTAPTWNTAGTVLTVTLGAATTVASGDTIDPTSAVKDSVGIADATVAALTITDAIAPFAPIGPEDTTFHGSISVALTSTGSSQILYTTDGTTPTCSIGAVYTPYITVSESITLKAVGCDAVGNASSVTTGVYTHTGNGGGGGGGGRSSSSSNTTSTATTVQGDGCAAGNLFSTTTGKSCGGSTTVSGSVVTNTSISAFIKDLMIGSRGAEVLALQKFLNTHGYLIASTGPGSLGNETTLFGSLTKAALMKYQKAKGITPAVGYFGPKTRAAVNAE